MPPFSFFFLVIRLCDDTTAGASVDVERGGYRRRAVLTKEQLREWEAIIESQRGKCREGWPSVGGWWIGVVGVFFSFPFRWNGKGRSA